MRGVVKVGGSLLADRRRLRRLLSALADGAHGPCIVVPGGGPFADAVREAQAVEGFDDVHAHRLALDAMGRTAALFRTVEGRLTISRDPLAADDATAALVWDPADLRAGRPEIPESWEVTSDSLALWLAADTAAPFCALVKSVDPPQGLDPAGLARTGFVDAAFPTFARRYRGRILIWGPTETVPVLSRSAA